jgi:hypothetical protein
MRPISRFEVAQIWVARIVHVSSPQRHSEPAGPRRLIRELEKTEGFTREFNAVREADFRLANALHGSLEALDLAHPARQWVPSETNLGHHLQVVDSKRLKIRPTPLIEPPGSWMCKPSDAVDRLNRGLV